MYTEMDFCLSFVSFDSCPWSKLFVTICTMAHSLAHMTSSRTKFRDQSSSPQRKGNSSQMIQNVYELWHIVLLQEFIGSSPLIPDYEAHYSWSRCLFPLKFKTKHIQSTCNTCNTWNMLRTTWLYAPSAPLWIEGAQVLSDSRKINNHNSKQSTIWFAKKPKAFFWSFSQQNKYEKKEQPKHRARIVSRQRSVGEYQGLKAPITNTLPCRLSCYQPPPPQAQRGAYRLLTIVRLLPYLNSLSMLYICFCP